MLPIASDRFRTELLLRASGGPKSPPDYSVIPPEWGMYVLSLQNVPNSARETLVLLWIIVLERHLQLDRLAKLALLRLERVLQHRVDALVQCVLRHFRHPCVFDVV